MHDKLLEINCAEQMGLVLGLAYKCARNDYNIIMAIGDDYLVTVIISA